MVEACGNHTVDLPHQPVGRKVRLGHFDRHRVDIAGDDPRGKHARGGHRQHGCAAADIGHAVRPRAVRQQPVERAQTAQRGAVMSGAKGHGRLDQERDGVIGDLVGVMAAVEKKAPRHDWRQIAAHARDPILIRHVRQQKIGRVMDGGKHGKSGHIGWVGEVAANLPDVGAILDLEGAHADGFGHERLHRLRQHIGRRTAFDLGDRRVGRHGLAPYRLARR